MCTAERRKKHQAVCNACGHNPKEPEEAELLEEIEDREVVAEEAED